MDTAKAARRASLEAEHLRIEAHGLKKVRQEGALGALPQGYGIDASRVAGTNKAHQHQNQDTCNLLLQNPRLQNDHLHPIMVEGCLPHPRAQAGAAHMGRLLHPLLSAWWMKERSTSLPLSKSRDGSSYLYSFQHSTSLPPWPCLLLLPTLEQGCLLPPNRRGLQIMRHAKPLFWHSALPPTLQRQGLGSPFLSMRSKHPYASIRWRLSMGSNAQFWP